MVGSPLSACLADKGPFLAMKGEAMSQSDVLSLSEIRAMQLAKRLQQCRDTNADRRDKNPMATWAIENNESGALLGFLMAGISGFFIGGALVFMLMQ